MFYTVKVILNKFFEKVFLNSVALKFALCHLGNFACFLVVCRFFFEINFLEKFFQEYHQNVKQFRSWPRGYKTFFMLNSAEHEIYPDHKC